MPDFSPHVTVACVVERDGRFLLVEEWADGRLVYNQPAGHVEAGESLTDAATRETLEESGWDVELKGVIGISLYHAPGNQASYLRTTFFAVPRRRLEFELDQGIERALWLSHEEMLANSVKMRSPSVLASVQQYLAGGYHPLSLIY